MLISDNTQLRIASVIIIITIIIIIIVIIIIIIVIIIVNIIINSDCIGIASDLSAVKSAESSIGAAAADLVTEHGADSHR